jgi:hypothetical protein
MAAKIVDVNVDTLRRELREARETERPNRVPNLREIVGALLPELEALRRTKWSDAQIVEWLAKRGLNISAGTLAQYLRQARVAPRGTETDTKGVRRAERPAKPVPIVSEEPEAKAEGKGTTPPPRTEGERKPEPSAVPAVPAPTRTPNAAAAIPQGKRRVNDDA